MKTEQPKANAKKQDVVAKLVDLMKQYPIVAAVDMENLPAKQLQVMRTQLRGSVELFMAKKRLIVKAIEQVEANKKGLSELKPYLRGMPALLFTKDNPFSLFKVLKKNKSSAPIKGGQIAPNDIVVPAGPTPFAPGPLIGELGAVGIKTGVEAGKIAIKADSVVAKEGDEVSQSLAGILQRLGIEPMEIGLNLTAAFENGEILTKEVLDVDEEAFKEQLGQAYFEAFNLAFNTSYPTTDNIELLLQTAFMDATNLALDREVVNGDTLTPLMGKAYAAALAVSGKLPEDALSEEQKAAMNTAASAPAPAVSEAPKEEKKEDKKEEKKEEAAAGLGALFG